MADTNPLQALDDALRAEPYRPRLLLERGLTRWSLGRPDWAEQDLNVLLAFNPKAGSIARILRLANGGATAHHELGVFLLGWPSEQIAPTLDAIRSTRERLTQFGLSAPNTAMVLVWSTDVDHRTVSFEIPHAALIEFGAASVRRHNLRASVAHEIAHIYLRCGRRFLDEGWAFYFQHQIEPDHPYPAPLDDMIAWSSSHEPERDLRALLCMPDGTGPFFDPFAKTDGELKSWYCRGVELVHVLVTTHGIDQLRRLMHALAEQPASEATNVFAECIGESIDSVQARLHSTSVPRHLDRVAVLTDACQGLRIARSRRNPAFARDRIPAVRALCSADANDHEARRALAQLLIADVLLSRVSGIRPDLLSIYEAAAFGAELRRAGQCASAELIFGQQAQCEMILKTNPIDRAKWSVVAKRHLERALAADADDPEILLAMARQELNTPLFGGDPQRGMELLARVEGFADYAEEVVATRAVNAARMIANA
jgi:hypothetical protein